MVRWATFSKKTPLIPYPTPYPYLKALTGSDDVLCLVSKHAVRLYLNKEVG